MNSRKTVVNTIIPVRKWEFRVANFGRDDKIWMYDYLSFHL